MKSKRVLVVDDMSTMRRIVSAIVKEYGCTVSEASCGREAFESLQLSKYDLVISDWNMPNMTGGDLVAKVRQTPGMERTPVVMLTAECEKKRIEEMVKLGVNGYIIKPFKPETLVKVLDKLFKCDKNTALVCRSTTKGKSCQECKIWSASSSAEK